MTELTKISDRTTRKVMQYYLANMTGLWIQQRLHLTRHHYRRHLRQGLDILGLPHRPQTTGRKRQGSAERGCGIRPADHLYNEIPAVFYAVNKAPLSQWSSILKPTDGKQRAQPHGT